ncbi:hypothetical protein PFNF135_03696 [Plasmodium falciparum NF135/5.C10]|nr:hypothetical protein PFNF135_03696 [Plasmodium falciparum NF135/5.C10]
MDKKLIIYNDIIFIIKKDLLSFHYISQCHIYKNDIKDIKLTIPCAYFKTVIYIFLINCCYINICLQQHIYCI